jgi:hypothetical protein
MTSTIKVNNIQNQCGANIINENSNTITIGASGDTIALASGASQTGFGRTGTVDWQTGDIKTSTFTAVNGQGFFVDTNGGAVTANLPAGSAGAIVSFQDYRNTFDSNTFTVSPSGSEKINGGSGDVFLTTEGEGITLVYIDSTVGWRSIQDNTFADIGSEFLIATGGTITTSGNCKIHTFTGPGTFTVCAISATAADNTVSYTVVAGGGGGGNAGGGGGAGGFREVKSPITPYTASPLDGYPSSPNRVTVTATSFPITVGGGGAGTSGGPGNGRGTSGANSIFSTITSAGGGGGGGNGGSSGLNGGSGGGGSLNPCNSGGAPTNGGTGNTPPVSPAQGTNGGNAPTGCNAGGGGGGATAAGANSSQPGSYALGGAGGAGATTSISGSPVARSGGGGGGGQPGAAGGTGGGGAGGADGGPGTPSVAGTTNTGGGGGGGGRGSGYGAGAAGGSGVVIIRYKFQ